jgi:hypothetical protein
MVVVWHVPSFPGTSIMVIPFTCLLFDTWTIMAKPSSAPLLALLILTIGVFLVVALVAFVDCKSFFWLFSLVLLL